MLPLAKLTVHQLSNKAFETGLADVGERIQGVLKPDPRRALSEKQGQKKIAASANGSRSRRKKQRLPNDIPTRGDIKSGWGSLLSEVTSSDKRVRVAKGGHFGAKTSVSVQLVERSVSEQGVVASADVEPPITKRELVPQEIPTSGMGDGRERVVSGSDCEVVEEEAAGSTAAATEPPGTPHESMGSPRSGNGNCYNETAEITTWQSYRIDEKKVPDKVLASMWRRAVDPKHCIDEIEPLAKVPRMTVTKREVEQLPAVHDIQHWRAVKTKRRAARKAHEESEEYPSLVEMMRTIFGEQSRLIPQSRSTALREKDISKNTEKKQSSVAAGYTVSVIPDGDGIDGEFPDIPRPNLDIATGMEQEEEPSKVDDGQLFGGVMRKGRRGALDDGRPWDRLNIPLARPNVEKEENKIGDTQRLHNNSHLSRTYEASQKAQFDSASMNKLTTAMAKVNDQCQRKVVRMHSQFVRKQGQLSARLTRRVQRLQMDFQETQDNKVGSILPSVVAWDGAKSSRASSPAPGGLRKGSSDRGDTVLQYLQHHRHKAEHERQSHHSVYLQQVERFQAYLRLLADPNRNPDRGELYLSECFRHVLAAGLIIDNRYFIRCLRNLEADDFEKTPTVNLLAACCVAFDIDLRTYWEHLRKRGLSCFTPRPQKHEARSWEDWAPWDGVRLDSADPQVASSNVARGDSIQHCVEDPFPFAPILPENTPSASELNSRNDGDPLRQILQRVTLDSVLERYQLHRRESSPRQFVPKELDDALEEEVITKIEPSPTGSTTSTQDAAYWIGQPRTPRTPPKDKPGKSSTPPVAGHTPRGAPGHTPRGVRKGGLTTLQRTRGVAEPMAEMAGAPDRERQRMATQSAMAPITERPNLE